MKTMMTNRKEQHGGQTGALVPVLWVAVTLAGLFVIGQRPGPADEPAAAAQRTFQPAPYVTSDPSLPPASSVLSQEGSDESAPVLATF